jgi:hypothetical protein
MLSGVSATPFTTHRRLLVVVKHCQENRQQMQPTRTTDRVRAVDQHLRSTADRVATTLHVQRKSNCSKQNDKKTANYFLDKGTSRSTGRKLAVWLMISARTRTANATAITDKRYWNRID